jgi:FAD/FMN-containing dehydrogenase
MAVVDAPEVDFAVAITEMLGESGVLTGDDVTAYATDWRRQYSARPACVARPRSTQEVAQIVAWCAAHGVSIVPHGGNTGMVGGAVPSSPDNQLVLSLERLNAIRDIDTIDMSMVVEAGLPLQAVQEAADEVGLMFPLSISSEGSAQIGGVVATNAGGNMTLRYGNARDMVLGLEVVLPNGKVWNGLRRLRKDNTGYCLRQLFSGAEGTLGIITAVSLSLSPALHERQTAIMAVPSAEAALSLLGAFRRFDREAVQCFEYMSGESVRLVAEHIEGVTQPFTEHYEHYVLVELGSSRPGADLRSMIEKVFVDAMEDGIVEDAVLSESEAQRQALWRLREEHAEAQLRAGPSVKNDVSVPVSRVPQFLNESTTACRKVSDKLVIAPFGHLGDGNIHYNLVLPMAREEELLKLKEPIINAVHGVVRGLDGSFSAEHGIGQLKRDLLADWLDPVELDLMRSIKHGIDPMGLMNPGKLVS